VDGPFRHRREKDLYLSSLMPLCNSYTDTVTPNNRNNQNCLMEAKEYSTSINIHLTTVGTTLLKDSHQRFNRVTPLNDIDYDNITTIYARLVVDEDRSTYKRKYISMRDATSVSKNLQ
jgi:hypothetical protein